MYKKFGFGFIAGIIIYIILHEIFNIPKILTLIIALFVFYILLTYLKSCKLKIMLDNLNKFVSVSNKYVENIIEERKEMRCHVHDIKNKLYSIKECIHKKDFTNMEDEVDKLLIECLKIYPSSICSNVYIDSFLSKFILNHPKLQYDIKINVPENINIKVMDLTSFILCLLNDNLIKNQGNLMFHMCSNDSELVTNVIYPNNISDMDEDSLLILNLLVKKYHGNIIIEEKQIKCVLFF